jgi:hypothetical protein
MSEMVERVARAIVDGLKLKTSIGPSERELARAAIEAMRVLPEDMPFPEAVKQYWQAVIDEALE